MFRVEVPIRDEDKLVETVEAMRAWLDAENITPSRFGYSLSSTRILFRIDFVRDGEAAAFADAFHGEIVH